MFRENKLIDEFIGFLSNKNIDRNSGKFVIIWLNDHFGDTLDVPQTRKTLYIGGIIALYTTTRYMYMFILFIVNANLT